MRKNNRCCLLGCCNDALLLCRHPSMPSPASPPEQLRPLRQSHKSWQVATYCADRRISALRVGSCCGVALSLLKAKSTEGTSCAARRLVAAARRGFLSGPTSSYAQPGSLRHCASHSNTAAVGSPVQTSLSSRLGTVRAQRNTAYSPSRTPGSVRFYQACSLLHYSILPLEGKAHSCHD